MHNIRGLNIEEPNTHELSELRRLPEGKADTIRDLRAPNAHNARPYTEEICTFIFADLPMASQ